MQIDFTIEEIELLSSILEDFQEREKRFRFLSCSNSALVGNLINKVDNILSQ